MASLAQVSSLLDSRYQILDQIGAGGMGAVFRATDRLTGQNVALKRVGALGEGLEIGSLTAASQTVDFNVALAQEFKLLASLRHPNIISVLDYGFDVEKRPYFTMSLLEQAQSILSYGRQQPLNIQIDLMIQMLQALAYLHRRGILHRDLKPTNVLITGGQVKVLDFGLALPADSISDAQVEQVVGTLAYMPAELLQGKPPSKASDLYAVGIILYELLVGRHPFTLHNTSRLIEDILNSNLDLTPLDSQFTVRLTTSPEVKAREIDPVEVNGRLLPVVRKLLAKEPASRYNDAYAVINDLSVALEQLIPEESSAIRESFLQAARFVGRDAELTLLESALQEALSGNGSTWLVGGESGVGKSRLLDELRIRGLVSGALVLHGQATAGRGLPYQLWRDVLKRLVLYSNLSDLDAGVLKEIIPDLETLLNCSIPDAPEIEGTAWSQRLIMTVLGLFTQQKMPIVLLLEDLQWASESLELLKQLNRAIGTLPLLLIGSFRSDEQPVLPDQLPGMQRIDLARLSSEGITELSESMLGDAGKRPEVIDLLKRETEGNALFLVEVVRALAEEAGRLQNIGQAPLPQKLSIGGIKAIIRRRLDRVPETARPLLKLAAVAGRQLDLALLKTLSEDNLDDWLTVCANVAVLHPQDNLWQFAHDKLREVLLSDLSDEERPRLFRQVAEATERVYPNAPAQAAVLTEYWHEVGDYAKEVHYARVAGEEALTVSRLREALAFGERALALLQMRGIEAEQVAVQRLVGEAYWSLSDYPKALAAYQASLELARQHNDQPGIAAALRGLGDVVWRQSAYADSKARYEESLTLYRQLGDPRGMALALQGLGWVTVHQGDYDGAHNYFDQSLTLCREIGNSRYIAEALRGLGKVAVERHEYASGRAYLEESLALCRAMGDLRNTSGTLRGLGEVAEYQGDLAAARAYQEESLALLRTIGDPRGIAMTLYGLGWVALQQGDYAMTRAYHEESLILCRSIRAQRGIATNLSGLGYSHLKLGNLTDAHRYMDEALAVSSESNDVPAVLNALATLAWLEFIENRPEQSAELFSLATQHKMTPAYSVKLLEPLRPQLEAALPMGRFAELLDQGKNADPLELGARRGKKPQSV